MSLSEIKSSPRECAVSSAQTGMAESSALERCYSPEQIAELWALSPDTVRRIFENESGVLAIERPRVYGKRRYRTLRIPESVAQRVYHQLSLKGRPIC
jgi:transcriptional regulator GlxA family with amidase domain